MTSRPNYETARAEAGFSCSVGGGQGVLRELAGIPIKEFNLDVKACAETYRRGRPLLREVFGEAVGVPGVCTPAVSYGHVNCLGSELLFPEGGEVAHTHVYGSLAEGVAALQRPVDWAATGMAPFYLKFREELQALFPEEPVRWGFGGEGPLTTAYELRGDGFFTDIYDDPPLAREFMRLTTDSILDFDRFTAVVNERPMPNPTGGGMCDDIASFISPTLFPEFVLPYWEQLYAGTTTGRRSAHVEDLRPEQLRFLEEIGLSFFDPSISPRLNPKILFEGTRVPFGWRLGCFHLREMAEDEIPDFVFQSAADGASGVSLVLSEIICDEASVRKVMRFLEAGREAKSLLESGCSRAELAQKVSPERRDNFWENWCGYLGSGSSLTGRSGTATTWGMRAPGL